MIKKYLTFALCSFVFILSAQNVDKNSTIFSVAGQPVSVDEFEYVYTKNNINNQSDFSEKSLMDYLSLYENFRLKVKEAEALKLDTIVSLQNELEGYRKQLAKSFLTDREISSQLIKEAYDRSLTEINTSHILVKCDENANPADTLLAYKKAMDIRKRILKGEDFGKIAQELSDDPSAKQNKGDIGYFTVFQTVYPFETAAYNAKIGEVSMPVRTNFGYHLVKKLSVRNAQGEITVAHLLKKFPENATRDQKAASFKLIDSIYSQLKKGQLSFDAAVRQFSDDRTSKNKGGELPPFGTGRMVPEFENAAFELNVNGDFSKPVQTAYGWHIIKRLDRKEIPSYEETKADLKRKVERDSRSQVAKTKLIDRIKSENGFSEALANKSLTFNTISNDITNGIFSADSLKINQSMTLFSLAGQSFKIADFTKYVESIKRKRADKTKDQLLAEYYDNFVSQKALDYEESQLEKKKPEFANLMREYRDGILLFELTDRKVWSYALKDTAGLEAFHNQNKSKYMWGDRAVAEVYNCTDKKIATAAHKLAIKNKTVPAITTKLNNNKTNSKVSVIEGKYEKGQYDVVDNAGWQAGVTAPKMLADSSYQFVRITRIASPEPKSLKEAKGFIISDYQEYLEKSWLTELRQKYPIVVNEQVLKGLVRK